jgi:uncharacterized phage-associated protein
MKTPNHSVSSTPYTATNTTTSAGQQWPVGFVSKSPIIISAPADKIVRVATNGITANVTADLIITFCRTHGDLVTNIKLQRLLYFAQGWFLGLHGIPLFSDKFQAWPSGPILPHVYSRFEHFGSGPINVAVRRWLPPNSIAAHIQEVMSVYGGFSSYDLQRIACSEPPWLEARHGLAWDAPSSNEIDVSVLKQFYDGKSKSKS